MANEKIYLQTNGYEEDYVVKGNNRVYLFQANADGVWTNTSLSVELLEELLKIAKNN